MLAAEARELGIIDEIVEENTIDAAIHLANKVAGKGRSVILTRSPLVRCSSA